jgi:Cu/Ag efflux protein CusF
MSTVPLCYAILALVTSIAPAAQLREAQPAAQTLKSAPVSVTATIEAIDQTNRIVTLKGPRGNLVDAYVDDSYKRFNDLKVGDQVKAQYSESLALSIRKPGDPAPTAGVQESVTPREGAPGATVARQLTASVTVTALDPDVPSISVKGPKGNVFSMRVQDPKRLEGVKVGDTIDVTYTQAMLIAVDSMK